MRSLFIAGLVGARSGGRSPGVPELRRHFGASSPSADWLFTCVRRTSKVCQWATYFLIVPILRTYRLHSAILGICMCWSFFLCYPYLIINERGSTLMTIPMCDRGRDKSKNWHTWSPSVLASSLFRVTSTVSSPARLMSCAQTKQNTPSCSFYFPSYSFEKITRTCAMYKPF